MTRMSNVEQLHVEPIDCLVLTLAKATPPEELTRLRNALEPKFPGRMIVILDAGDTLEAHRPPEHECPECGAVTRERMAY